MNYYELFQIPESVNIDKVIMSQKYIALQKKYHPDFFTNKDEIEKESALSTSAEINKAYKIFSNKEKTIEYLLQLKGIISSNEKYNLPPDFLMDMMELNEKLDDENRDSSVFLNDYQQKISNQITPILAKENIEDLTDMELQELKEYYYKAKYLKRILDRIED